MSCSPFSPPILPDGLQLQPFLEHGGECSYPLIVRLSSWKILIMFLTVVVCMSLMQYWTISHTSGTVEVWRRWKKPTYIAR